MVVACALLVLVVEAVQDERLEWKSAGHWLVRRGFVSAGSDGSRGEACAAGQVVTMDKKEAYEGFGGEEGGGKNAGRSRAPWVPGHRLD